MKTSKIQKWWLFGFLALLPFAYSVAESQTSVMDDLRERASDAMSRGEWGQASELLSQILKDSPEDTTTLIDLARCRYMQDDFVGAIDCREQVRALESENALNLCWLASYYTEIEDWQKALDIGYEGLEVHGSKPDQRIGLDHYWYLIGRCLSRLGRIEEGFQATRRSLGLNPKNLGAAYTLDELLFRKWFTNHPVPAEERQRFATYQASMVYLEFHYPDNERFSQSGFLFDGFKMFTTWHDFTVVSEGADLTVLLPDGKKYPLYQHVQNAKAKNGYNFFAYGDRFGDFAAFDIAVDPEGLYQLESTTIRPDVGDTVFIPLNNTWSSRLDQSVIKGRILSLEQRGPAEVFYIEGPGSSGLSGSPVLNSDGKLVGILTGGDRVSHHCLEQRIPARATLLVDDPGKNEKTQSRELPKWLLAYQPAAIDELKKSIQELEEGEVEGAITRLRNYTDLWPKDYSGWLALALAQSKAGRSDEVEESLEEVFAIQTEFPEARTYEWLGEIMMAQGEYAAAIGYFRDLLAIVGCAPEIRLEIIASYVASEQRDEAIDEAHALVAERPEFAPGYLKLGQLYFEKGDFAKAKIHLESGLTQALKPPDDPEILNARRLLASLTEVTSE